MMVEGEPTSNPFEGWEIDDSLLTLEVRSFLTQEAAKHQTIAERKSKDPPITYTRISLSDLDTKVSHWNSFPYLRLNLDP